MLPPNVTALSEARERKAKKANAELQASVSEAFPTKSRLLMPGTPEFEAIAKQPSFYWHARSDREELDRYVCGHGYDVEPGGEAGSFGEVETWRRPEITLYDSPDQRHGTMCAVWPEGKPEPRGLLTACLRQQKPCFVVVNCGQWETARNLFESRGYIVLNRDAPWTQPNSRDPR